MKPVVKIYNKCSNCGWNEVETLEVGDDLTTYDFCPHCAVDWTIIPKILEIMDFCFGCGEGDKENCSLDPVNNECPRIKK